MMSYLKKHYRRKEVSWLPYTCIFCYGPSQRKQDLCESCYQDLPTSHYSCYRCARPFNHILLTTECGDCLKNNPPFDRSYALYLYQLPIPKFIMDLKFGHSLVNARILPALILPMPLHSKRLQERGFNQAVEIARPMSKHLGLPLELRACQRIKNTAAQTSLSGSERRQNVKNAFLVTKKLPSHVAIVDDVVTTGQTITELSRTLKRAGVTKIDIWCCARPVF
jgi:ComF family protein